MRNLFLILVVFHLQYFAQIQDTCKYVKGQNLIGGLDCSIMSIADYTADSYQWLNCDSSYIEIPGQTSYFYTGVRNVSLALKINYLGCIDTSDCAPICFTSIEEHNKSNKKLLRVIDYMGNESDDIPNIFLIYIYSDGTREKVFRVE